jgi:hypothetical protein
MGECILWIVVCTYSNRVFLKKSTSTDRNVFNKPFPSNDIYFFKSHFICNLYQYIQQIVYKDVNSGM